jgi:hypothetical protein
VSERPKRLVCQHVIDGVTVSALWDGVLITLNVTGPTEAVALLPAEFVAAVFSVARNAIGDSVLPQGGNA